VRLAESVAGRARHFYRLASQTLPASERRAMIAAEVMGAVYWRLLGKIEGGQFQVFGPKLIRLNKVEKFLLIFRTWFRCLRGSKAPNYGIYERLGHSC
jgi:phytoene synthase